MPTDTSPVSLKVISSMATRHILTDLTDACERRCGATVSIVSVGGVEAARRIREGERCDIVVLASDALARLGEAGYVELRNRVDVARSKIAVAVKPGECRPDISSEASLRDAVLHARTVGYSTGPSGNHIIDLFERWGIHDAVSPRLIEASPGVPVGSLVAEGTVEIGFQQLSELIHQPGIDVIGMLPEAIQNETIFSAALSTHTENRQAALTFLACLADTDSEPVKLTHGMEPV